MRKITPEILTEELGFVLNSNIIQDSYDYILEDNHYNDEDGIFPSSIHYKSISATICNDKGLGEYYIFIREGNTDHRHEDEVLTITRNMLYVEDLKELIRILTL